MLSGMLTIKKAFDAIDTDFLYLSAYDKLNSVNSVDVKLDFVQIGANASFF